MFQLQFRAGTINENGWAWLSCFPGIAAGIFIPGASSTIPSKAVRR